MAVSVTCNKVLNKMCLECDASTKAENWRSGSKLAPHSPSGRFEPSSLNSFHESIYSLDPTSTLPLRKSDLGCP